MAWTTTGVSQHETAGSLLPVAPSTRLVASTYQRRTIHDTSQVATGRNRSRPFHADLPTGTSPETTAGLSFLSRMQGVSVRVASDRRHSRTNPALTLTSLSCRGMRARAGGCLTAVAGSVFPVGLCNGVYWKGHPGLGASSVRGLPAGLK